MFFARIPQHRKTEFKLFAIWIVSLSLSLSHLSPVLPQSKISRPHLHPCHNGRGPQAAELSQTHNHRPTNSTQTHKPLWQADKKSTNTRWVTHTNKHTLLSTGCCFYISYLFDLFLVHSNTGPCKSKPYGGQSEHSADGTRREIHASSPKKCWAI